MALEHKLVQKLSQSLLMTPQLRQAIQLLQLGRLEYKEAIDKELLENPVLEEVRDAEEDGVRAKAPEEPTILGDSSGDGSGEGSGEPDLDRQAQTSSPQSPVSWEDYLENFSDSRGAASPRGYIDHDDRPSLEATLTRSETLHEHISSQVRFLDLTNDEQRVVAHAIGNLDKDGYLCISYEEIAQACDCEVSDVERVMSMFKTLDPPGVGARNLSECLYIQLENQGMAEGLEAKIVTQHLERLERRRYDQIAKLESVAVEEVYKAVTAIQDLEPRPGRPFIDDTTRYITPDIYVYKDAGEYVISLNEDGLPRLRVSPYYLELLKRKDADNSANREYLTERLKAASWLIKSIHQRQQTIYKVTESIVKFQREFLDYGIERLKPLVLKEVADDIGMHESTVSRVTTNKYVHTPQGVFELKYFFTTGIKTANGDVSSSTIKDKIKNIISAESHDNPISDQQIVDMLKADSIEIARRTVAKYRETLNIPSSSRRKKPF